MNSDNDILVSVCMLTYNQEQYIAEAIESVINQQTNFKIELILSEDCGPDKTREICIEYQKKYPEVIVLNLPKRNIGAQPNFLETLSLCRGKYIAICEGDDYWTDPLKLQKQVDLMENNPTMSMCAHASQILMCDHFDECKIDKSKLTTEDLIGEDWGIMTASILFRNSMLTMPDWYEKVKNGDYALQLLLSLKGNIGYLPDNMSVYRQHFGGVSASLKPLNQTAWIIFLLDEFNKYTNGKYKDLITARIRRIYKKQIYYAKGYGLRKAAMRLKIYQFLAPIAPFLIKSQRK